MVERMFGRALCLCFGRTCLPRRSFVAVEGSLDAFNGRIGRVRFDAKLCRAGSRFSLSIVYNTYCFFGIIIPGRPLSVLSQCGEFNMMSSLDHLRSTHL